MRRRCRAGVRSRQSGIAHGRASRQQAVTRHSPRRESLAAGRVKLPRLSGLVSLTPRVRFAEPRQATKRFRRKAGERRPRRTKTPPHLGSGSVDADEERTQGDGAATVRVRRDEAQAGLGRGIP